MREVVAWLSDLPILVLLAGLAVVCFGLAVGLTFVADRVFEPEARSRTSGSMTTVIGVIAALYAVMVTFVIVNEWQAFNDAQSHVSDESAALVSTYATANLLEPPARTDVQLSIVRFDRSLLCDELPQLRDRQQPSLRTRTALADLYATVARHRSGDESRLFDSELSSLSDASKARRAMVNSASSPIPDLLLATVVLTSIVLIATVSALDTKHRRWHLAITTALSVIVALNLLLVVMFARPFDGAAKISDAPLREGVPAALLRCGTAATN